MSTLKMHVTKDAAQTFLAFCERQIADNIQKRNLLSDEIKQLEIQIKKLRKQVGCANGRALTGANLEKIRNYFSRLEAGKKVRASAISKATGITQSSVAFTMQAHPDEFSRDGKYWKFSNEQAPC